MRENAIDRSKCFVALLSEHAAESAWMRKEIAYALEKVERGEWREEDLIVVCLDGAADAAAKRADKDDPFVRMSGIAAKFSDASNAERTVASVCGQIKRCLERKTCERFLRESKEECSVYKSTIYGQIPGEEGGLLKSRFSMDGAYMRPALFDAVSGQPVSPQAIMKTPVSFRLIGAGGVGKSLFVRYLIKNYMGGGRIFIKLDLSDGEILSQLSQARSLRELLNAEINRYAEDEAGKSDGAFARLADGGSNRIFIVFDGMDELEEGGREKLARLAEAHFKQYPSHKFIVTSRTQEGIGEFDFGGEMRRYRLEGFRTQAEAAALYDAIAEENAGYLALLGGEKAKRLREEFCGRLHALPEAVMGNPLLLSNLILIWLQSGGKNFPASKYEILQKSVEIFMNSLAAVSGRADADVREYLQGDRAEELFQAIAYRRLWGNAENSALPAGFFGERKNGDAGERARKLAAFLKRRKIFDGGAICHDVFTAYFACAYLYRKIYREEETRQKVRRIVFRFAAEKGESVGKKRLKSEVRENRGELFPETAADLVLALDSRAHACRCKAEMDGRHPSYPVFFRTLKIIRRWSPQARDLLLKTARGEEELWYGDFVRETLQTRK